MPTTDAEVGDALFASTRLLFWMAVTVVVAWLDDAPLAVADVAAPDDLVALLDETPIP